MVTKLYAPQVYRFAYHLSGEILNYEWLKETSNKICDQFSDLIEIDNPLSFKSSNLPPRITYSCLADGDESLTYRSHSQILPVQRLTFTPLIIHDSEALQVDSYIYQKSNQDALDIEKLGQRLNPNNCLNLLDPKNPDFLGQTLLLTTFVDPDTDFNNLTALQDLATTALGHLLHRSSDELPDFYRPDRLFGSPLFEFGNPRFDPVGDRYLVLFYRDEPSSEQFVNILYPKLSELFCYYHKILYVFSGAHQDYHAAQKRPEDINESLVNILQLEDNANPVDKVLSVAETQAFKQHLKHLLRDSIKYSRLSRRIEHSLNTLALNQVNYQTILEQWQQTSNDPLPFFQHFLDVEAKTFQTQLQGGLTYVKLGGELLSQATNTIQGLIAVDEAERDRHLQNSIGCVGAGIGAGSIFATSYAERLEKKGPDRLPIVGEIPILSRADPVLRSFTYSLLVGFIAICVVWLGFQLRQRGNPKRNNKKIRHM